MCSNHPANLYMSVKWVEVVEWSQRMEWKWCYLLWYKVLPRGQLQLRQISLDVGGKIIPNLFRIVSALVVLEVQKTPI